MRGAEAHTIVARVEPRRRWLWASAALILLAYVGAFALLPQDGFWVCDDGAKFIQVQGLLRSHYHDYAVDWPGQACDPTFRCSPLHAPFGRVADGRLYVAFPPFFALISSFPFRFFGYAGLCVLPLAAGLATLWTVWRLAGRLEAPSGARPLAVLLVGLGTPLWFYSLTFWEHTPATALVMGSVLLLVRQRTQPSGLGPATAGVCCGTATWFREDAAVFGVGLVCVILLYHRHRWRDAALFVAAVALTWVPLGLFQWWALGHPLGHHVAPHDPFAAGLVAFGRDRWTVLLNLLVKVHETLRLSWLISGLGLLAWAVNPRVPARAFRWLVPVLAGLAAVGAVTIGVGYLRARSPVWWMMDSNGFFAASTVLCLAFVRVKSASRTTGSGERGAPRGTVEHLLWALATIWTALYVLIAPPHITEGIHWACRYLLPVYPLLGVLAAGTVARWWQGAGPAHLSRVVVVSALGLAVAAQVYALDLLRCRREFVRELNHVVAQRPEQIVITDVWHVPMDLSPNFHAKVMFVPNSPHDALQLTRDLYAAGHRHALLIRRRDPRLALPPNSLLLDDPALNFSPLVLTTVALVP